MRSRMRSLGLVVMAVVAVVVLGWTSPVSMIAQLLATTALIMGGTQHPLSPAESPAFVTGYLANAAGIINATPGQPNVDNAVAVITPEEFFPTYGSLTFNASVAAGKGSLDSCIRGSACDYNPVGDAPGVGDSLVVYGYSQSAVIASLEKRDLIQYYLDHPEETPDLSFVLVANPMRPNGGILERFSGLTIPILDVTFYGATPTSSDVDGDGTDDFLTTDITRQYDGWSDFPVYPLNLLADANAVLGILYLHGDYSSEQMANAVLQGEMGDTTYYMIATDTLPLLIPLQQLGVPSPIIKVLDAPLRVLVEMGYDRETNPGEPTPARLIRLGNPIADAINLAVAIPTGLDDGIEEVTGTRPFNTEPTDMYGVHVGDALFASLTPSVPLQISTQSSLDEEPTVDLAPPPAADPAGSGTSGSELPTLALPGDGTGARLDKQISEHPDDEVTTPPTRKGPLLDVVRNPIGFQPVLPNLLRPGANGPLANRPLADRPLGKVLKTLSDLAPKLPKLDKPAADSADQPAA